MCSCFATQHLSPGTLFAVSFAHCCNFDPTKVECRKHKRNPANFHYTSVCLSVALSHTLGSFFHVAGGVMAEARQVWIASARRASFGFFW